MKVKTNIEKYGTALNRDPSENIANISGLNIIYNKSVNIYNPERSQNRQRSYHRRAKIYNRSS
jgi:hypothetical protein